MFACYRSTPYNYVLSNRFEGALYRASCSFSLVLLVRHGELGVREVQDSGEALPAALRGRRGGDEPELVLRRDSRRGPDAGARIFIQNA